MDKMGTTAYTVATEADRLEALLSAAGLASEQIDLAWSKFVSSGYKAAQREVEYMAGFSVVEVERAPEVPSQAQQGGALTIMQAAIIEAGDICLQALARVDAQQQKALFDDQGRPRVVPEENQRLRAGFDAERTKHVAQFRDRLASWEEDAQKMIAHTDQVLLGLQRRPVEHLRGDELAAAAARDRFVERDTQQQSLGKLTAQAQAALARGDRVALALLATHLPTRLQAERQQLAERGDFRMQPDLRTLDDLVREAEGALLSEADRVRRDKMIAMRADAELTIATARSVRQGVDPAEIESLKRRFGIR